MKVSNYTLFTLKNIKKKNITTKSVKLMLMSGMIRRLSSGLYTWLPTGLKVLQNIKKIIKIEMNKINAMEILIPTIQPIKIWKASNRIEKYGKELIKVNDRYNKKFILNPTNEETITFIIKNEIKSYKQLPVILYQINFKFRDEIRYKYGIIRSKEFLMKDAYSFHIDKKSLKLTYKIILNVYKKIFNKIGISYFIKKEKNNKIMGGKISHKFYSYNFNILKKNKCIKNKNKKIEIAHIFQIGNKYSKHMKYEIKNKDNKNIKIKMGCYGIGVYRLIASYIEQNNDDNGIIWNKKISPFKIAILPINMYKYKKIEYVSNKLYERIKKINKNILFYDKKTNSGEMFSEIDLIGIPHILIISKRNIKNNEIEYKYRKNNKREIIKIKNIMSFIKKKI